MSVADASTASMAVADASTASMAVADASTATMAVANASRATKQDLQPLTRANVYTPDRQSDECTIFRVGKRERRRKSKHFNHELIFLGLYNRLESGSGNPKSDGDKFRLEIVGTLLQELGKTVDEWDTICQGVVQSPEEMRKLYNGVGNTLDVEAVRNVLTLDALFLACCLGTYFNPKFEAMFRPLSEIFKRKDKSFCNVLFIDILKLENQIPLSLIGSALQYMFWHKEAGRTGTVNYPLAKLNPRVGVEAGRRKDDSDLQSICDGFTTHHSGSLPFQMSFVDDRELPCGKSEHLLHYLYESTRRGLSLSNSNNYRGVTISRWRKIWKWVTGGRSAMGARSIRRWKPGKGWMARFPFHKLRWPFWETTESNISLPLPSATMLHKAGIQCCGRTKGKGVEFRVSLFKATLFLPAIHNIGNDSELLWRNLVAYEYGKHGSQPYLMSYLDFMDTLINTEKDVGLLRSGSHPVIATNSLGEEKAIADLYNSILRHYDIYNSRFEVSNDDSPDTEFKEYKKYKENLHNVTKGINAFCNHKPRQNLVEFGRTYFSRPWLVVPILAAGTLLVLTFLQTFYSMMSYIHNRDN